MSLLLPDKEIKATLAKVDEALDDLQLLMRHLTAVIIQMEAVLSAVRGIKEG